MEQVEGLDVVGLLPLAGDAHHQHEVHEAMGGVARLVQRVQGHLGQAAVDVAGGDPVDRLAVELRVGSVLAELARPAELQRQVAGADDRDPLVAVPRLDPAAQMALPSWTNRCGCGSGGAKMFV